VEMAIPDKPKSKNQSYRLTEKGKNYSHPLLALGRTT